MYNNCYKCGATLDEFPSHLCPSCRAALVEQRTPEDAIKNLSVRLTKDDFIYLQDLKIRIDPDMRS